MRYKRIKFKLQNKKKECKEMERKEVIENIEFGFWDNLGGMKTPKLHCELIKLLFINNEELAHLKDYERSKVVRVIAKAIATNKSVIDSVVDVLDEFGVENTVAVERLRGQAERLKELFNEIATDYYKRQQGCMLYREYKAYREYGNNLVVFKNGCSVSIAMFHDKVIKALEYLVKATQEDEFVTYMSTKYKSDQMAVGEFFAQLTHNNSKNIYDYCDTVKPAYEVNDDYLDDISTIEDVYKLCSNGGALSEDDIDNTMIRVLYYNYYTNHIYNSSNPRAVFKKEVNEFIKKFERLFLYGGVL